MRSPRAKTAWLISLGVHLVAFTLMWWVWKPGHTGHFFQIATTTVDVEIVSPSKTVPSTVKKAAAGKKLAFKNLGVWGKGGVAFSGLGSGQEKPADLRGQLRLMDFATEGDQYQFYSYLFDKIDERLTYPSIFKEYKEDGVVYVRLAFLPDGKWDPKRSTLNSPSPYLAGLVRAALKDILRLERVPANVLAVFSQQEGLFWINCLFRFDLNQGIPTIKAIYRNAKNELEYQFYRAIEKKGRWGSWSLGPVVGGDEGVGVDVMGFARKVLTSKESRKKEDLGTYRDRGKW